MMTKNQINEREQLEMLTIEQLVPKDHLVRKLDAAIERFRNSVSISDKKVDKKTLIYGVVTKDGEERYV